MFGFGFTLSGLGFRVEGLAASRLEDLYKAL